MIAIKCLILSSLLTNTNAALPLHSAERLCLAENRNLYRGYPCRAAEAQPPKNLAASYKAKPYRTGSGKRNANSQTADEDVRAPSIEALQTVLNLRPNALANPARVCLVLGFGNHAYDRLGI